MAETTSENPDLKGRMHVGEDARQFIETARTTVTGSPFVSVRTLVLLSLVAVGVLYAPMPYALIAGIALILLTFDIGRARRA